MRSPLISARLTGWLLGLSLLTTAALADDLLRISGSSTLGEHLAPALAAKFLEQQDYRQIRIQQLAEEGETEVIGTNAAGGNTRIHISWHGSSQAFADLASGQADIGAASRPINTAELGTLSGYGNLRTHKAEKVVGLDGIALIVHPNNPLTSISLEQAAAIFSGTINNWQEIGGPDLQIQRYARDEQSGTWAQFRTQVLGQSLSLANDSLRLEHNDELSGQVAGNPQAIGFVPVSAIGANKALALHTDPGIQISPDYVHITTEDYPLARRLYLYRLPTRQQPLAEAFFEFVSSDAGQQVVADSGFIGQQIDLLPQEFNQELSDTYRTLVSGYQRLSVNFRFHNGSSRLDNKAQYDTLRLAQFLLQQPEAKLLLVGFAESGGNSFEQTLSKLRAQTIRKELIKAGIRRDRIAIKGQGAQRELPSASEEQAKLRNRRVEAWISQI